MRGQACNDRDRHTFGLKRTQNFIQYHESNSRRTKVTPSLGVWGLAHCEDTRLTSARVDHGTDSAHGRAANWISLSFLSSVLHPSIRRRTARRGVCQIQNTARDTRQTIEAAPTATQRRHAHESGPGFACIESRTRTTSSDNDPPLGPRDQPIRSHPNAR